MTSAAARIARLRGAGPGSQCGQVDVPTGERRPAADPRQPHLDDVQRRALRRSVERAAAVRAAGAMDRLDSALRTSAPESRLCFGDGYVRLEMPARESVTESVSATALLGGRARRLLLFDTETTGLAGGTGTCAFVLGLCEITAAGAHVAQWLLLRPGGEAAMLAEFASRLGEPEDGVRLVTYNGRSFDVPLLVTRLTLARQREAARTLVEFPHVDLLQPVRRAFSRHWPDCRQATMEQRLLGRSREDDLPGSQAPLAWQAWLATGDGEGLAQVARHNRADLDGMTRALSPLDAVLRDPVARGASVRCLAQADGSAPAPEARLAYLERHADALDREARVERAHLARRLGRTSRARTLWGGLLHDGEPDAALALAKLEEHAFHNPRRALELAEWLIARQPGEPAHVRRRERLQRKLARA